MVCSKPLLTCPGRAIIHGIGNCQNATKRIDGHYLDSRNCLLEFLRCARQSTTSSGRHDHVIELAVGLLKNLLSGAFVVCQRVTWVLVLVKNMTTHIFCKACRKENVRVFSIPRCLCWCSQDLRTQGLHGVHFLARHFLWHADDHFVTL